MAFIEDSDYDSSIYAEIITAIIRNNPVIKADAEDAAVSEMKSYLSSRYDIDSIFTATGSSRNKVILMFCKDIAIYHMHVVSNPRGLPEVRKKRYDDAISWLKEVSRAKINPDLPILSDDTKDYIRHGGNTRRNNHF